MEESLLFASIMRQEARHAATLANAAELDIGRLQAGLRSLGVSVLQSTSIDPDLRAFLASRDLTTPSVSGSEESGPGTQNGEECIMEELGARN